MKRKPKIIAMAVLGALTVTGILSGCAAKVTEEDLFRVEAVTPVAYEAVADIYVPNTGIVNPPTVVQRIHSKTGFPNRDRCPAVTVLTIDEQLQIVEGTRRLTDVETFMALYRDITIPAFWIDSKEEADALIEYLGEASVIDAYVMASSDDGHLVRYVREQYRYIQGALWFADLADRKQTLLTANNALAAVICTQQPLSMEDTAYFNSRMLSVWGEVTTTRDVYSAVSSGYNGIICADTNAVYDVYESLTATTVCGKSIVIGHRGCYGYLENTLTSFRKAYDVYGCDAVEMDLRLTSDGEIVLMHDATVDRTTNGTGVVADLTLAQIKQLQVDSGGDGKREPVPTFEEVLQTFSGTDLVLVCHMNVRTTAMARRFSELVRQYQCEDQIVVFYSYDYIRDFNFQNHADGLPYGAGNTEKLLEARDDLTVVENFIRNLVPFHYQPLFYDYVADSGADHSDPAFYYQLSARGFLNWHSTTNGRQKVARTLLTGVGATAALINELAHTSAFVYRIDAHDISLSVGEKLPTELSAVGQQGTSRVKCGYLQLDGAPLAMDTLQQAGSVTVVYYASLKTVDGDSYIVLSSPVTVTFR